MVIRKDYVTYGCSWQISGSLRDGTKPRLPVRVVACHAYPTNYKVRQGTKLMIPPSTAQLNSVFLGNLGGPFVRFTLPETQDLLHRLSE